MPLAGMAVTFEGENADLSDPIGYALRRLGYDAALSGPTDEDLAYVGPTDVNALLDVSELRVLDSWLSRYSRVDFQIGDRAEKLSQVAEQVRKRAERLRRAIEESYNLEDSSVDEGTVVLNFAQHLEDAEAE
jgi:hypothetical protein